MKNHAALYALIDKWRKESKRSYDAWMRESDESEFGIELQTNYRDLEMCANELADVLDNEPLKAKLDALWHFATCPYDHCQRCCDDEALIAEIRDDHAVKAI